MSYGEQFVLAEEIGREVARNIKIPSQPEVVVRTEEVRPTKAHIVNHHLNNANEWYRVEIPRNVVTWQLRMREDVDIKYSYSPSHATYFTLRSGEVLSADVAPDQTLNAVWVVCETANTIAELETWTK